MQGFATPKCMGCGKNIGDGEKFCKECSTKKTRDVVVKNKKRVDNYPLTNFARKNFLAMLEIGSWVFLLFIAGVSSYLLYEMFYEPIFGFFGFIIGAVIGFLIIVFFNGLIAHIVKISDDIEKIKQNSKH